MAKIAGVGLVIVLALGFSIPAMRDSTPNTQGAIRLSCVDAMSMLDGYFASTISDAEKENVISHLEICPNCRKHYEQAAESRGVELLVSLFPPQVSTAEFVVRLSVVLPLR